MNLRQARREQEEWEANEWLRSLPRRERRRLFRRQGLLGGEAAGTTTKRSIERKSKRAHQD